MLLKSLRIAPNQSGPYLARGSNVKKKKKEEAISVKLGKRELVSIVSPFFFNKLSPFFCY